MYVNIAKILFLAIIVCQKLVLAQGLVQIENYSPDEYSGSRQNWTAIQSNTGTLFFGNGAGLLHFDGNDWSLKHVPAGGLVRSFGTYNGDIYWGGNGDIGRIKADSLDRFLPVSYLRKVDSSFHNFSSVWRFVENNEKLYARTYEGIYTIDQDTIIV